jgi:hypothetical protein
MQSAWIDPFMLRFFGPPALGRMSAVVWHVEQSAARFLREAKKAG